MNTDNKLAADKQRFTNRMIPSFRLFFIELFSVVLGVILALMLNQWSENRSIDKKVNIALSNVANEIQANSKILKIIHKQNALVFQDSTEMDNNDSNNTFTPAIQLQETAWNTFLSTGLSTNIDYELLLLLSQVYSIQGVYKSFGNKVVESYLNITALSILLGDESNETEIDEQIKNNLEMVFNAEGPLLELYSEALNKLNAIQITPND
ncbi:hypothetical protein ACFL0J_04190 [Candidatus Neomarinimicrobiota bacterium]